MKHWVEPTMYLPWLSVNAGPQHYVHLLNNKKNSIGCNIRNWLCFQKKTALIRKGKKKVNPDYFGKKKGGELLTISNIERLKYPTEVF